MRPDTVRTQPVGKGTFLTPEVHEAIVRGVRKGNYLTTVCKTVGLSYNTVNGWITKGKPEEIYNDEGEIIGTEYPNTIYGEFTRDLHAANAKAEVGAVEALTSHFADDWRAAAEFLSRKFPERWNPKIAVEHTGKDGGPIEIEEKRNNLFSRLDVLHIERNQDEAQELESGVVDAEIVSEPEQLALPLD